MKYCAWMNFSLVPRGALVLCALSFLAPPAAPQGLHVRVRAADGTPTVSSPMVQLTALVGSFRRIAYAHSDSLAIFSPVGPGEYIVEVTAVGYQVAREQVTMFPGGDTHISVLLRSENAPATPPSQPAGAVLAPKIKKQFDAAVEAMIKGDLKTAQENLDRVVKAAPGYANAHYLLGVLFGRRDEVVQARASYEKAIGLDPSHAAALFSLGRLYYLQNNFDEAVRLFEQALALDNVNWEGHWMMSAAQLARYQFERARIHSERARALAGNKAPQIALVLAQALYRLGETSKAEQTLEEFLRDTPENAGALTARDLLAQMRRRTEALAASKTASDNGQPGEEQPAVVALATPAEPASGPVLSTRNWSPPDVESETPPVDAGVSCSLPSVLRLAGKRVVSLVENLQGVTARERIELVEFDRSGKPSATQGQNFGYMMTIQEPKRGIIYVEEDRRPEGTESIAKQRLASEGLPALALVFHPYYSGDYEMKCEGLSQVNGQAAWQVYFRQRTDKPARIRVYRTRNGRYAVSLKGRAWFGAASHEILRLETGMVAPLPEAELQTEHLSIRYAPIRFEKRNLQLYLPASVDLYTHFRGRRQHMRHSFSNFTYFAVDVRQTIHDPKVDAPKDPPND